jgi:hypothetical protein
MHGSLLAAMPMTEPKFGLLTSSLFAVTLYLIESQRS